MIWRYWKADVFTGYAENQNPPQGRFFWACCLAGFQSTANNNTYLEVLESHLFTPPTNQPCGAGDRSQHQRPPWAVDLLRQKIVNSNTWCLWADSGLDWLLKKARFNFKKGQERSTFASFAWHNSSSTLSCTFQGFVFWNESTKINSLVYPHCLFTSQISFCSALFCEFFVFLKHSGKTCDVITGRAEALRCFQWIQMQFQWVSGLV